MIYNELEMIPLNWTLTASVGNHIKLELFI